MPPQNRPLPGSVQYMAVPFQGQQPPQQVQYMSSTMPMYTQGLPQMIPRPYNPQYVSSNQGFPGRQQSNYHEVAGAGGNV